MNAKFLKDLFKTALSLGLGIAIIWLLYRNTNLNELWKIAKSANLWIIFISLFFGLLGNYIRGLRWELFLKSLGYNPKRASIVYATLGNYAVNFLLPRAGDFWRCAVVSKYDEIPFSKTFGTFVIDKILDLSASVVLILLSLLFSVDFFISYFRENPEFAASLANIFSSFWILGMIGIFIMGIIVVFRVWKENPIVKKITNVGKTIKHDLKLISQMKEKKLLIIYTICVWLSFYLYFYICFYAFDFTEGLGFMAGWIVFAMSNVGVAVPVQGGIGAWHFMVISSLVILGVTYEQASAFAGAVFIIQSIWIILVGVFGVLALPYVKRGKENLGLQTAKN